MLDRPRALLTQTGGKARELVQVDLRSQGKDENWLRDRIFEHPEILPINDIAGQFWPAVPLGTEIDQIDALFVSPGGYLTIVETKLVDNPEARRTVLAQVLDYARTVSTWSTEDLAAKVAGWSSSKYNRYGRPSVGGSSTTALYSYVRDYVQGRAASQDDVRVQIPDQALFLTELQRNLQHARLLILVVGERDLARTQDLADTLQHGFAFLQFTLAVVELTAYRFGTEPDDLLIVPRVVLRTNEIRRSVARIEVSGPVKLSFPGPSEVGALQTHGDERKSRPVTDDDFLDHLANSGQATIVPTVRSFIDFLRNDQRLQLRPTSTGISVRQPDPGGSAHLITLFWLDLKGINFYYLRVHLRRLDLPADKIADEFYAEVVRAFGVTLQPRSASRAAEGGEMAAPYPTIVPFSKLESGLQPFSEAVSRVVAAIQAASTEQADPEPSAV